MAVVEASGVRVRRAPYSAPAPASPWTEATRLRLAPWVALLTVPSPTLAQYSRALQRLQHHGPVLLEAILDTTYRLAVTRHRPSTATGWIMVVRDPTSDSLSLEAVSPELGAVLAAARPAVPWQAMCAEAVRLGATPQEAVAIIEGLVADQVLLQEPCSPGDHGRWVTV
jgi:hypothetical protein